jgi:hypothetical protein
VGNDYFWPAKDVSMLEEKLIFLLEKGIQEEGFSNLQKRRMSYGDHIFSSPYNMKDLMLMRKLTI